MGKILGCGTDIVEIERISKIYDNFGGKFLKKILGGSEMMIYEEKKSYQSKISFIAKRFAAKEAFVKALGIGFRKIAFNEIEIVSDENGKPIILINQKIEQIFLELFKSIKILTHISISDERKYANALVILEKI